MALLLAAVIPATPGHGQEVRIRLLDLHEPVAVDLSAHEGPLRIYAGEHADPITELLPGQSARIERASNQLHVTVDGMALYATSLRIEPDPEALFGIEVSRGAAPRELRRYAGGLHVVADGSDWEMRLINTVPLEEYVASVVATEYGLDDLEGSKAMAVLVRTYTLGVLGKYGSDYDHVDHTLSQVYRGADAVTAVSRSAARATEGEVLTYDGKLIRAVYSSSSGGHTADNETVWEGPPLAYLRGKPDPYDRSSPHAKWSSRLPRSELLAELSKEYGKDLEGFLVEGRSSDGRVTTVVLLTREGRRQVISANDFRLLLNRRFGVRSVRSALFDVRRVGDEYVFEGQGFGHGVGLSQWGAHEMAQQGMSYRDILDFYYTDVALAQLDGVPTDVYDGTAGVSLTEADPIDAPGNPAEPEAPRGGSHVAWGAADAGHSARDTSSTRDEDEGSLEDTISIVRERGESAREGRSVQTETPVRSVNAPAETESRPRRRIGW